MRLKPKDTIRTIKVDYGDGDIVEKEQTEDCIFCCDNNCILVGKYGTYNKFGSFTGVCLKCLNKLQILKRER